MQHSHTLKPLKLVKYLLCLTVILYSSSLFAMRCGNALVQTGDSKYKVEKTCGEPTSKDVNEAQNVYYPYETIYSEIWTYDRTSDGGLIYDLTFIDGRLNSIDNE